MIEDATSSPSSGLAEAPLQTRCDDLELIPVERALRLRRLEPNRVHVVDFHIVVVVGPVEVGHALVDAFLGCDGAITPAGRLVLLWAHFFYRLDSAPAGHAAGVDPSEWGANTKGLSPSQ